MALTNAEKQAAFRWRKKERAKSKEILRDEMIRHGYASCEVFIHPAQLKALGLIEKDLSADDLDPTKLSFYIFSVFKLFINRHGGSNHKVREMIESGDLPEQSNHEVAKMEADLRFSDWKKESIEGFK